MMKKSPSYVELIEIMEAKGEFEDFINSKEIPRSFDSMDDIQSFLYQLEESKINKPTFFARLKLQEASYLGILFANLTTELLPILFPIVEKLLLEAVTENFLWCMPFASMGVGTLLGWSIYQLLQSKQNRTNLLDDIKKEIAHPGPTSLRALMLNGAAFFSVASTSLRALPLVSELINNALPYSYVTPAIDAAIGSSLTGLAGFFSLKLRQRKEKEISIATSFSLSND